jgi:hypothetical protein
LSNQKFKSENYTQLGGINSKASPYLTGPHEFLDLQNLDFQTPGSLSERWGSTQYFGQTFPGQINSLFEFSKLDGSSYVVSSYSGGIHFGATTGNVQGVSLTTLGATVQVWGAVCGLFLAPPATVGSNRAIVSAMGAYYKGDTSIVYGGDQAHLTQGQTFYINPFALQSDNTLSCAVLNDRMFLADGSKFLKFDGATVWPVGLPGPLWATNTLPSPNDNTVPGFGAITGSSTGGQGFRFGPSLGTYYLFASYVNNRGFEGPIWPLVAVVANNQFNASIITTLDSGTTGTLNVTLTLATPIQYGISTIKIYSYYDPYNTTLGQTYTNFSSQFYDTISSRFWNLSTPVLLHSVSASGSTITTFPIGTSTGGMSLLQSNLIGPLESTVPNSYTPLGLTLAITPPSRQPDYVAMTNFYPRFLETYQNRLIMSGFSAMPSQVWFSDTTEPEGVAIDSNFEVRTNDGDYITGMKSYSTRLYIFKKHSFHALNGDSPTNFFLQEISAQYGCFNNRCAVIYDDILIFLDQKGVMMWNGASLSNISQKIQPLIDRINYSVALNTACVEHDKLRNQILIAVPIDGSSTNNILLVYDYLVGAWTTYKGLSISALKAIQGRNNTKNAFYGSYSGTINWFGSSYLSDNGTGFTTYLKTRFLHDMGDTTQKMFRRLYLNADAPSATMVFGVNFFQDYGSSVVLGATIVLGQFQNRIDFGISAKSIAFELATIQTSGPLRIHGYTVESRYLRRT